jgi:hypothetical protein
VETDERQGWRAVLRAPTLSPLGLILWAAVGAAAFAVLHAAGLRDYATVLCGSSPTGKPIDTSTAVLAGLYIVSWFVFVLAVPFLVLAAIVQALVLRLEFRPPFNESSH